MTTITRTGAALLALAFFLAACGGDDAPVADLTATTEPAEDEEPTVPPAPPAPTTEEEASGVKDAPTIEATIPPAPSPAPAATATPVPVPAAPAPPPAPAVSDAMDQFGDDMGAGGAASYDSYVTITDDTGAIQLDVPAEWTDIDGRPYTDDQGRQLFDVRASPDLQGYLDTWDVPAVIVTASREVAQTENEVTLLDELVGPFSEACTYLGREPYDDGLYVGQVDVFDACGGTQTGYIILGAVPSTRAFVIRVQVQVVEERDIEALIQALNTFVIVGDV